MMIDPLSLLWVRHVAFVYLKLSSKAHGRGFVLSKPRQFVSSEANIEVSSFSCWSPSSLISPLCNKDTNMKMSSHTTLWVSVHNTCKILPHSLEEGSIRPHVFTPQLLSPDSLPCQPPEEQDIFFSLTLIGVFCLEGVHISSLKEIEKQMKQYNHPQSFKVTEHSKQWITCINKIV